MKTKGTIQKIHRRHHALDGMTYAERIDREVREKRMSHKEGVFNKKQSKHGSYYGYCS